MDKFTITCYKLTGVKNVLEEAWKHAYEPSDLTTALNVGYELARDYVCDSFRVDRVQVCDGMEGPCNKTGLHKHTVKGQGLYPECKDRVQTFYLCQKHQDEYNKLSQED
jgi:hypothetical protein